MDWMKALYTVTPTFKKMFREDERMILVLGNVTYHHGYNKEAEVPESDCKKYNTGLLGRHGLKRIRVERTSEDYQSRTATTAHNFDVPEVGGKFPRVRSASDNGVSKEIALATRTHFKIHHPDKLHEKV